MSQKKEVSSSESEESVRCSRRYTLGRRKEIEDETRRRILEVSAMLLVEQGGSAFTMDAVARASGVTRQTVHNQFGTRLGLLEAMCENAIHAEAFAAMPEVFQQSKWLTALELLTDIFCKFWNTNRHLMRRLRGLARAEPELESLIRQYDERRLIALRSFVDRYGLASGEQADRAVQILFALTSYEFFEALLGNQVSSEHAASEMKQILRLYLQNKDQTL